MATSTVMPNRSVTLVVIALAAWSLAGCATSGPGEDESVCAMFGLEAVAFDNWRDLANRGRSAPTVGGYSYEALRIDRPDRPSLVGYRVSLAKTPQARRALLFLQGNAMRVDQLRHKLTFFADRGFDVFVFDYRGYGGSDGVPLLKPISLDQADVAEFVANRDYDRTYLYGISMGGIFALGPYMPRETFDAIAIDSSPAELPWYSFCPSEYDPIANVPEDASNMIVLSGGQDRVVPAEDVAPLGAAVEARGGAFVHEPDFGHPLSDGYGNTQARFSIVLDFFDRTAAAP